MIDGVFTWRIGELYTLTSRLITLIVRAGVCTNNRAYPHPITQDGVSPTLETLTRCETNIRHVMRSMRFIIGSGQVQGGGGGGALAWYS